jgi:uncharacterized protein YjbI with pentapeptide repeats/ribosomal protein L29
MRQAVLGSAHEPEVTAAIIAAGVGVLTLAATVVTQISGRRATSRDTQQALKEQREQLNTTLAAQREQLDKTLTEQRTRTFNERFATAAGQLGSDKPPDVRLAGVYAMAGLADDWEKNRQTCVDVLCAYLRMPYEPDPGQDAPLPERLAFRASREVRHTVIRVITAHLKEDATVSWQGLNFDFTGVVFDGGDFAGAKFSGGDVYFYGAEFSGGMVNFQDAEFSGSRVTFYAAKFSSGEVWFNGAKFSSGEVWFNGAKFSSGEVSFMTAKFSAGKVHFSVEFSGGLVVFNLAEFSGGTVDFSHALFSGGTVDLTSAHFSGGKVDFAGTKFFSGKVDFSGATFSGGSVDFRDAESSGGELNFGGVSDWSFPPAFPWTDTSPPGVKLPKKEDQSQA